MSKGKVLTIMKSFSAFDALEYANGIVEDLKTDLEAQHDDTDEDEYPDLFTAQEEALEALEKMSYSQPDAYNIDFADYPTECVIIQEAHTMQARYHNALSAFTAVLEVAESVISSTEDIKDSLEDITGYEVIVFPE